MSRTRSTCSGSRTTGENVCLTSTGIAVRPEPVVAEEAVGTVG
jgi:hypothetical protein